MLFCGVCEGNILCSPHKVLYPPCIEEAIDILQEKKIDRWIALKWLDGNPDIMQDIEKHLHISFDIETKNQADEILEKNRISSLKDVIVSSIMFEAEELCRKTVRFDNENYSERDRKIDKILTSKRFRYSYYATVSWSYFLDYYNRCKLPF